MRAKLALKASSLFILATLLFFCGQKGALYIQEDEPKAEQSISSKTAPAKADTQPDK